MSKKFKFTCSGCPENFKVDEDVMDSIIRDGCPMCGEDVESNSFTEVSEELKET